MTDCRVSGIRGIIVPFGFADATSNSKTPESQTMVAQHTT